MMIVLWRSREVENGVLLDTDPFDFAQDRLRHEEYFINHGLTLIFTDLLEK
jgi:hypothetical protein